MAPHLTLLARWRGKLCYSLLVLAFGLLIHGSAGAGKLHDPLKPFLKRSVQSSADGLDSLAASFNPAQLPLLAWGLWTEARTEGLEDPALEYEALIRWHRWLGRRLDPANHGFWQLDPRWMGEHGTEGSRRSSILASLELLHLEALAGLAEEQGLHFDALVWWRDHSLLQQRLLRELHNGVSGGFQDLDSNGVAIHAPRSWAGLLPAALGAPLHRGAAAVRLRKLLALPAERGALISDERAANALGYLDPLSGWGYDPALSFLEPATSAALLLRATDQLRDPALAQLMRDSLPRLGFRVSDELTLPLGPLRLPISMEADENRPLRQARMAIEHLLQAGFVPSEEAAPLLESLALEDSEHLADRLANRMADWSGRDLEGEQRRLAPTQRREGPVDHPDGAFRYRPGDSIFWANAALDRLREAVIALYLEVDLQASYRAWLNPERSPIGAPLELRLRLGAETTPMAMNAANWSAAWTDGQTVLAPFSLDLHPLNGARSRELVAEMAAAPPETGLWWLLIFGPEGRPHGPPELTVVEPLVASLHPRPAEEGSLSRTFDLRLVSQIDLPLSGRVELRSPPSWTCEPLGQINFHLEGHDRVEHRVILSPSPGTPPGPYKVQMHVFDESHAVARLSADLAVHYRWIKLGPFPTDLADGLTQTWPPDAAIELARRYPTALDSAGIGWEHVSAKDLSEDGWVNLISAQDAPGVYYALTALSTTTRDAQLNFRSPRASLLRINGEDLARIPDGGQREAGARFMMGANYVIVKMVAGGGLDGRFMLELDDIGGGGLAEVENELGQLLDGYDYVGGGDVELSPEQRQRVELRMVTVIYEDAAAKSVSVVGSFNGWSPTATPMRKDSRGRWVAEIPLRTGDFEYKIAVDGNRWIKDPTNRASIGDGFGGLNSLLVVD